MKKAIGITLTSEERSELQDIVKSATSSVRDVFRSKIILFAAQGKENIAIAEELGTSVQTISMWRNRYAKNRLKGLNDCVS
ncbi:MAG: hypothetical protein A2161_05185 [Candidatus Schekmanbacteria bacterium RBG_13_48_7]|uniref:Transposase n=1 Tax=Candidatus Schekmanbacteria bacterium RBG_13_48_7 TaxID=1817878 RepID=A0A1F7S241_9BACT|nr:MAG: hypothetical protein A2161_05185 [Candidatus Schekmanbacteria bacterium RBG_13_48_7]